MHVYLLKVVIECTLVHKHDTNDGESTLRTAVHVHTHCPAVIKDSLHIYKCHQD